MGYTSIILTELEPWQAAARIARIEAMTRNGYHYGLGWVKEGLFGSSFSGFPLPVSTRTGFAGMIRPRRISRVLDHGACRGTKFLDGFANLEIQYLKRVQDTSLLGELGVSPSFSSFYPHDWGIEGVDGP